MGDYRRDEMSAMLDLDLNQDPVDLADESILGLESIRANELELTREGVHERIRQLEAVYARARWRQNGNPPHENLVNIVDDIANVSQEVVERSKGVKRDSSHLVAKALELDLGVAKAVGDGEGFFDCNICLDTVREPVLTCCGHLFCWACFYRLPYVYSTAKECPICKGEVMDTSITPIYGNGNGNGNGKVDHAPESDSGEMVPPRPKANRVESLRQNRVMRRVTTVPVADALRRIRIGLSGGLAREPAFPPDTALAAATVAVGNTRRLRTRLVGRALAETDDVAVEGADQSPAFGFVFDSPVIDMPLELNLNEPQPPSSRRRIREARGRRRAPRS